MDYEEVCRHLLQCLSKIEDYFEYSHDSEQDKRVVMGHIDRLSSKLEKMRQGEA